MQNRWPVLLVVLFASSATARAASFEGLGGTSSYPRAVSADGSVVVGEDEIGQVSMPFRWMGGVHQPLVLPYGAQEALAWNVSGDGAVVVGNVTCDLDHVRPVRWFGCCTVEVLSQPTTATNFWADATAVNADGSKIVGDIFDRDQLSFTGLSWSAFGYAQTLDDFEIPADVSADGRTVVGVCRSAQGVEACRLDDGQITLLGDLAAEPFESDPSAVSADGATVVGTCNAGSEACVWRSGEIVDLGTLPGFAGSNARGVSGNGAVVVGKVLKSSGPSEDERAFIWDQLHGMRDLHDVLSAEYGLDLSGWKIQTASAMSDDGGTIVGWGRNPEGGREGWRAVLPEPEGGAIALVALLTLAGLRLRFSFE